MSKIRVLDFLVDLIFPNRCPFCDTFIKWDKHCCDECLSRIAYCDSYCGKCGKIDCVCNRKISYDGCEVAIIYDDFSKNAFVRLKHEGGVNLSKMFTPILCEKLRSKGRVSDIDIITCVPMTKHQLKQRGYNQAEIIAKDMAKNLKKDYRKDLLIKIDDKIPQHSLRYSERINHANKTYSKTDQDLSGKTVLLCDDILTTASTMDSCAKALKAMGAKRVYCVALASTFLGN